MVIAELLYMTSLLRFYNFVTSVFISLQSNWDPKIGVADDHFSEIPLKKVTKKKESIWRPMEQTMLFKQTVELTSVNCELIVYNC